MKRIYLASPFFNAYELSCVQRAEAILQARGFEVFSPRLHEVRDPAVVGMAEWSRETFRSDRDNIDLSDLVVTPTATAAPLGRQATPAVPASRWWRYMSAGETAAQT